MPNTDPLITPLNVSHFFSSSHSLSRIHFSHSSLPPLCPAYSHPPIFCSDCLLHQSVRPALPPTWLFLPCLARNHPAEGCEWDDSVCVSLCTLSEFSVCVERKRRRKRQWVKDASQVPAYPYPSLPPSLGPASARPIRADLLSVTHKDLWKRTHRPQWLYNNWPTFGDPDSYFNSVSLARSVPSLDF